MSRSQGLGGFLHGAANALVGGAAAEIAAHRRIDVRVGGFAVLGQEADRRHDLPGLAIAALRHIELDPGVLNRLRDLAADALDRRYGFAGGVRDWRLARAHGLPVEMDGAGAARGDAAAVFRAREIEEIPESPEERHVRIGIDRVWRAVDRQVHHELLRYRCPAWEFIAVRLRGGRNFAPCCKEGSSLGDAGLYGIIGMNLEVAFMNAPRERERPACLYRG